MKRTFILTSVLVLTAAVVFSSCGHSRVWANKEKRNDGPPPVTRQHAPPRPSYNNQLAGAPLIITPHPGFTMARHANGNYFHRGQQGMLYWKGFDNRFYLDKNQVDRSRYSKFEIKEWKRYSRHSGK